MTIGDTLIIEETVLNEGIVFFKTSKKLKKLAKRLKEKSTLAFKNNKVESIKEIEKMIVMVNEVAKKFEDVEKLYKQATSKPQQYKIRQLHEVIQKDYVHILEVANKEVFRSNIKKIGSISLMASLLFGGLFGVIWVRQIGLISSIGTTAHGLAANAGDGIVDPHQSKIARTTAAAFEKFKSTDTVSFSKLDMIAKENQNPLVSKSISALKQYS